MKKEIYKKITGILLVAYCLVVIWSFFNYGRVVQWDFKTYYYAAKAFEEGFNPYDTSTLSSLAGSTIELKFIYLPLTLLFFRYFSFFEFETAFSIFLGLKIVLLAGLIYLWTRVFVKKETGILFFPFCFLAFNFTIYNDIVAGNLSIIEQFLIWLAFYFYMERRLLLFSLTIPVAAIFKITPMAFLILLVLVKDKKKYSYMMVSLLLFSIGVVVSYALWPQLFMDFLGNLAGLDERGMSNPSTLPFIRDISEYFSARTGLEVSLNIQWLVFCAVASIIIVGSVYFYNKMKSGNKADKERVGIFLLCLAYALILPRFKDYSYILLIVPAYYILTKVENGKVRLLSFALVMVPSFPVKPALVNLIMQYYPLILAFYIWLLYITHIQRSYFVQNLTINGIN